MTTHQEDHLARAKQHVAEGEHRVANQKALIAQLEQDGHDTTDAQAFLETLQQTLEQMREHLRIEIAEH